jgi:hypothetical protein
VCALLNDHLRAFLRALRAFAVAVSGAHHARSAHEARDRSAKKKSRASKKSLTKNFSSFTVLTRKEVPSAMAAKKKKATTKKSSAKKTTKKGKK